MKAPVALLLAASCLACAPPAPPRPEPAPPSASLNGEAILRAVRARDPSRDEARSQLTVFADAVTRRDAQGMTAALGEGAMLALPWPAGEARGAGFVEEREWPRAAQRTAAEWLAHWG